MGKVFKIILVVAVIVAVVVFLPQLLPMISTALGTVTAAGTVALTTLGQVVMALALTAVSMVAQMLMAPKPPKLNNAMADRLNTSVNPIAPRKIIFGQTCAGADVRFEEKIKVGDDEDPDYFYQVIALASHKLTAVQSVYLEDEVSWNGVGVSTGKFGAGLQFSAVLEGNTANAASFGTGNRWTVTSKFTGCAYLKIRYKMDFQKIFPDGMPTRITTIVQGCPVFDPRHSTTVGGSGTQNPADQTTWAYTTTHGESGRNPACALLTYLLGWKINGKLCWGMGIPPEHIDFANFITYANVCDEAVTVVGGGTVKRYQCDTICDTSMSHESIINNICNAMGTAKMVDSCGFYQLVGGYDDTDGPTLSFTSDDLGGPYEWKPYLASRDTFNIARGRYADPSQLYVLGDWGRIEIDPLADGIPRTQEMDFASVSRAATCQRIAKQRLVRNQYQGAFTCIMGPRAFGATIGSLITLSLPNEGWNNKLFRVMDQTEAHELIFQIVLQEESPTIYAWDSNETLALPSNVDVQGYDPLETLDVEGLVTSTTQVTNSTGGLESFIDVEWTIPPTTATSIQVQSKPATETVWSNETSDFDASAGVFRFRVPAGGVSTDVQARFRMHSGAFGPWATANVTAAAGGAANPITGALTDESVTFAADSSGNIL
jgi:hypothetical protein